MEWIISITMAVAMLGLMLLLYKMRPKSDQDHIEIGIASAQATFERGADFAQRRMEERAMFERDAKLAARQGPIKVEPITNDPPHPDEETV